MVTIQSQNFGVEIEMTGVSRGTAASVIANYFGVGGIHFAGGTYQTYEAKDSKGRVWKCMRDGSITPRRRIGDAIVEADDTYRCEVVTSILQYEDITDLLEIFGEREYIEISKPKSMPGEEVNCWLMWERQNMK